MTQRPMTNAMAAPASSSTRNAVLIGLLGLGVLAGTGAAADQPSVEETPRPLLSRAETLGFFEEIAAAPRGFSLRAWVNEGSAEPIRVGSNLSYHFLAEQPAYLSVIHLDAHGVATLLLPNGVSGAEGGTIKLAADRSDAFPASSDSFALRAEPPVGQEQILAIATTRPLPPQDLGLTPAEDAFTVVEAVDAPRFAARLRDLYFETPVDERAAFVVEQRIAGRTSAKEYSALDIVDYFTTRTRSIKRPRLDLHIRFALDSDVLDTEAQRNLVEVAEALQDPRLVGKRFVVAGHTDDSGTAEHNQDLSARRAESVVSYLEAQGIDGERFEMASYGESRPLESNQSNEGRRMNRRVEFELLR